MPVYTSDALILRTYKLGEADRIVVFLTRDRGKKRGVAKGARRREVALRGRARVADARRGRLLRARAARSRADQLHRAAAQPPGHRRPARGERVGARSRRVLRRADRRVGAGRRTPTSGCTAWGRRSSTPSPDGAPTDRLARYFEFWLLRLQGVYPQLVGVPACGGPFDGGAMMPAAGALYVCLRCAVGGRHVDFPGRPRVPAQRRGRQPRGAERRYRSTPGPARELETAHRRLIHLHLEKELKSARVLRQMRYALTPWPFAR